MPAFWPTCCKPLTILSSNIVARASTSFVWEHTRARRWQGLRQAANFHRRMDIEYAFDDLRSFLHALDQQDNR